MTDDELRRAYWSAAYHDEWYSGNNPGKQTRLSKGAGELKAEMRARKMDTSDIDQKVQDGLMPPYVAQPK